MFTAFPAGELNTKRVQLAFVCFYGIRKIYGFRKNHPEQAMLNPILLRQAAITARENERARIEREKADQRHLTRKSISGDLSDIDAPVSWPQRGQCWIDRDGKPYRS